MVLRTGTTRKTMKWIKKIINILPFCFLRKLFLLSSKYWCFLPWKFKTGRSSSRNLVFHFNTEEYGNMTPDEFIAPSGFQYFEIIATTACENATRTSKVAKLKQMEMLNWTNWTSCDRAGFIYHLSMNSNKLKVNQWIQNEKFSSIS